MTKEEKLARDIANAVEDHWFNPAVLAHLLSNQPHYTIDRIMEIVAHILKFNSKRYKADFEQGVSSEGLYLANELNKLVRELTESYKWNNLKLPVPSKEVLDGLPDPQDQVSRYSWLHDSPRNPFDEDQNVVVQRRS